MCAFACVTVSIGICLLVCVLHVCACVHTAASFTSFIFVPISLKVSLVTWRQHPSLSLKHPISTFVLQGTSALSMAMASEVLYPKIYRPQSCKLSYTANLPSCYHYECAIQCICSSPIYLSSTASSRLAVSSTTSLPRCPRPPSTRSQMEKNRDCVHEFPRDFHI